MHIKKSVVKTNVIIGVIFFNEGIFLILTVQYIYLFCIEFKIYNCVQL
jgi:hypothetical protein